MRVVVCGSYGDLNRFLQVLDHERSVHGESNVFPSDQHLKDSATCIEAHHGGKGETSETIKLRSELMDRYFEHIDGADLVVFVNEKNGQEHYGVGTMIELGYAFARRKEVLFTKEPTNANITSLLLLTGRRLE